jgi:hypothetical protein
MMRKYLHLRRIEDWGLPTVIYDFFQVSDIGTERLRYHVDRVLSASGYVGVRTEPKDDPSPLGDYPHGFPFQSLPDVEQFMLHVAKGRYGYPNSEWWFLVNEAFVDYRWNGIIALGRVHGRPSLLGEINTVDNAPLREALRNASNVQDIANWRGPDKARLFDLLKRASLEDRWFEVSKVVLGERIVFWGMRRGSPIEV